MALRISRPTRMLVYVFGGLLALYLTTVAVMSTEWFRRLLTRHVTTELERLTGARVEFQQLSFRAGTFELTLGGVVLHGKEAPTDPPLFSARTLVMGFSPFNAVRRRLLLRSLDLEDAAVHVRTYPDGSTNLPGPPATIEERFSLQNFIDLSIHRLVIARTNLFWNNRQVPLELGARDFALVLRRARGGRCQGSLSSSELTLRDQRRSLLPLTLSAQLDFSGKDLILSPFFWRASSTGSTPPSVAGQGSLNLRWVPEVAATLTMRAAGEVAPLARALGRREMEAGSFRWDGQADYRDGKLDARGHLEARDVLVRTPTIAPGRVTFSADYSADANHVEISNFVVSMLHGSLRGRGEVRLGGNAPRFTARAELRGLDLASALQAVPDTRALTSRLRVASTLNGTADISWRAQPQALESSFDLQFKPGASTPAGVEPVSGWAQGHATLTRNLGLELKAAELHTPHSSWRAHGTLGSPRSSLAVEVQTADFQPFEPAVEYVTGATEAIPLVFESPAGFTGNVSGALGSLQVQGQLSVGAFEYQGWAWQSFTADVVTTPGEVVVSRAKLQGGNSVLDFEASAGLDHWLLTPASRLHLTAEARHTPLAGLLDALNFHEGLSGYVTGRLSLDGRRDNLSGGGVVRINDASVSGESIDSLSATVRVSQSVFNLEAIDLRKGSGRASGQARLDSTRREFTAQLRGAGFALSDFRRLVSGRLAGKPIEKLTGLVSFDLNARGTADNPDAHSSFHLTDAGLDGVELGDIQGQVDWQGHELRFQSDVTGKSGSLRLAGKARAEGEWPLEAKGEYTNLRLDPWLKVIRPGGFPGSITASGSLTISGPARTPARLQLTSQTESLALAFPNLDLTWKNQGPIEVSLSGQKISIARLRMSGPSTDFSVGGSVQLGEPAPAMALQVEGRADAALLALIDPVLQALGHLDVNFRVNGTPLRPLLYGSGAIRGLSLGYGSLPFHLAGLNGDLRMEGERLTVGSLDGSGGGGTIHISGIATLGDSPRFDFQAQMDQARVEFPTDFTSVLSGKLQFAGGRQSKTISGDLQVRQLLVPESFDLLAWMGKVEGQGLTQPTGNPPPLGPETRLDVHFTTQPVVRVESRNVNAVGSINLTIRGTVASPVGFGEIRVQGGEVLLRGNRYKLTRGDINLTNPFRTQADLDFEATTRIEHYDLTLDVNGPPDRMKISYRSDPPLPTSDILSLLALGYSRQEQTMAALGARQSFGTVGASALLSQALSSQVSGRIQRLFGVSRITIDPNVGSPVNAGAPRVTVEEQFARDLTITYSTNAAGSQQRIIQIEWDLSDKVSVIGERDQNGVLGLELRFRHSFR